MFRKINDVLECCGKNEEGECSGRIISSRNVPDNKDRKFIIRNNEAGGCYPRQNNLLMINDCMWRLKINDCFC